MPYHLQYNGQWQKGCDVKDNRPKWLFDESNQVGVDYMDTELVGNYDAQHERFRDFKQEARRIATALKLSKQSTVLDIGCGICSK